MLSAVHSLIIWLSSRAGKMSQMLRFGCLPERARWSFLARSGLLVALPLGIESLIHEQCNIFFDFLVVVGETLTKMLTIKKRKENEIIVV